MSDDDSDAPKSHQCVDCKVWSPETNTNYTLISARYGWRLSREVDARGVHMMSWRCPTCWTKWKATSPRSPETQRPPRLT